MADRTAPLGYEYDAYEQAPTPQHLTSEEAAARQRTYQTLHAKAMSAPHAGHHGASNVTTPAGTANNAPPARTPAQDMMSMTMLDPAR